VRDEPQPSSGATYARKVDKEEALLDWTRPAIELERAIRAYRPAPGAATRLGGETLKLWRAQLRDERGAPGEVLRAGETGLVIACGEQALQIEELQRQGGRKIGAADFLRGYAVAVGARLG
jgi:methionyl-tRNA formyltransferase